MRANEWAVAPVECFAIFQSRLFSPKGYFLVCFLPLTQWPTYRSYHCTQWRQSGPVWKWTGRAGAFTRNESEADKSSSFKIRLALCTLCRLYFKFLSNWAPKGNCIVVNGYVWWRQNPPENNVQLIVTQTAALFCSPAPSAGKSHCVLIISKRFAYNPFRLSFKLETQMRRNMPLTKESSNKEKHKQQYPNFCDKIKWDSYSKQRRLARKRTAVHVSNGSLLMFPLNLSKQASIFNLFSRSYDTTPKRQHLKKIYLWIIIIIVVTI